MKTDLERLRLVPGTESPPVVCGRVLEQTELLRSSAILVLEGSTVPRRAKLMPSSESCTSSIRDSIIPLELRRSGAGLTSLNRAVRTGGVIRSDDITRRLPIKFQLKVVWYETVKFKFLLPSASSIENVQSMKLSRNHYRYGSKQPTIFLQFFYRKLMLQRNDMVDVITPSETVMVYSRTEDSQEIKLLQQAFFLSSRSHIMTVDDQNLQ